MLLSFSSSPILPDSLANYPTFPPLPPPIYWGLAFPSFALPVLFSALPHTANLSFFSFETWGSARIGAALTGKGHLRPTCPPPVPHSQHLMQTQWLLPSPSTGKEIKLQHKENPSRIFKGCIPFSPLGFENWFKMALISWALKEYPW